MLCYTSKYTRVSRNEPSEVAGIAELLHEDEDLLEGLVKSVESLRRFLRFPLV